MHQLGLGWAVLLGFWYCVVYQHRCEVVGGVEVFSECSSCVAAEGSVFWQR